MNTAFPATGSALVSIVSEWEKSAGPAAGTVDRTVSLVWSSQSTLCPLRWLEAPLVTGRVACVVEGSGEEGRRNIHVGFARNHSSSCLFCHKPLKLYMHLANGCITQKCGTCWLWKSIASEIEEHPCTWRKWDILKGCCCFWNAGAEHSRMLVPSNRDVVLGHWTNRVVRFSLRANVNMWVMAFYSMVKDSKLKGAGDKASKILEKHLQNAY